MEPPPGQQGKHGIAPPAMQERHCARQNATPARAQAATLDQLRSLSKLSNKLGDLAKIIAIVGITHQDPPAVRGFYATHQGVAVTFSGNGNHPGTFALGDNYRRVSASVVRNQDLSGYGRRRESL